MKENVLLCREAAKEALSRVSYGYRLQHKVIQVEQELCLPHLQPRFLSIRQHLKESEWISILTCS
jgi:hypothetical protein